LAVKPTIDDQMLLADIQSFNHSDCLSSRAASRL